MDIRRRLAIKISFKRLKSKEKVGFWGFQKLYVSKFVKEVSVQLEISKGELVIAEILDNSNGSCTTCFINKQAQKTKLIVSVDGSGEPNCLRAARTF